MMSSLHNMRRPSAHRRGCAGALVATGLVTGLCWLLPGAARAEAAKAASSANSPSNAASAVPSEPGTTTASYGDWVLRCQRLAGENAMRVCEVAQTMQVQGQAAPIAQVAVGRPPGHGGSLEGLRVTVLLPANVSFPSSVRITQAKEAVDGLDLAWRRCIPGGCLADAAAPEAVLKGWRGADEPGRIAFKDAEGREVAIPLSFRGLSSALDALAKEKS